MTMRNSLPRRLLPIGALALAVALGGCDDSSSKGAGGSGVGGKGGSTGTGGHAGSVGAGGKAAGGATGTAGAAGGSTGTAGAAGGSTGTAGAAGGSAAGGKGGSAAGGAAAGGSAAGGSAAGGSSGSAGGAGGSSLAASLCPATGGMYTSASHMTMSATDFCTLFLQYCGATTAGHTTLAECMTTYTGTLATPVHAGSDNGTIGACESYHMCNVIGIGTAHCVHAAGTAICVP